MLERDRVRPRRVPPPLVRRLRSLALRVRVRADLAPHSGDKGSGLYDLTIEVPPGTDACQYLTSPLGRVAIVTDHPRIGTVELKVSFAVLPR